VTALSGSGASPRPGDGTAPAADVAALEATLARMARQLEEVAAESRRSRERWEALDELVRDATPLLRDAIAGAATRLQAMEERGYGEVLGAGLGVLDDIVRSFDRKGIESIGDTIVLLLKTIQGMR
jgi:hypothetical protein